MIKTIPSIIGMLTLITGHNAEATQQATSLENLNAGVLYELTPQLASALNINFLDTYEQMRVNSGQKVLIKFEDDGSFDLSIYENEIFNASRVDGVVR